MMCRYTCFISKEDTNVPELLHLFASGLCATRQAHRMERMHQIRDLLRSIEGGVGCPLASDLQKKENKYRYMFRETLEMMQKFGLPEQAQLSGQRPQANLQDAFYEVAKHAGCAPASDLQKKENTDMFRDKLEMMQKFGLPEQAQLSGQRPQANLQDAFYKVANLIPDANWLEFVRCGLGLDDKEFKDIVLNIYTNEGKRQTLQIWRQKEKVKSGVDPSAEHFMDLVAHFLHDRPDIHLKTKTLCKPGDLMARFRQAHDPGGQRDFFCPTFNDAIYFVIRIFPDANWMEFVYFGLDLNDDEIGHIKCEWYDKERKYQILKIWASQQVEPPTAEILIKLAEDFRVSNPGESITIQQNFGVVNTKAFVGYGRTINIKDPNPPSQASGSTHEGSASFQTSPPPPGFAPKSSRRKRRFVPLWSDVLFDGIYKQRKQARRSTD